MPMVVDQTPLAPSTKPEPDPPLALTADRFGIRADFVPKESYISRDFLELEKRKLWPKVWQIACREEEIPNVGDYVVYEIAGESILVVRAAPGVIKSYYNVCQHRGRILKEQPHGSTKFLYCRYHGWRWTLDGRNDRIVDPDDWNGCQKFGAEDLRLKETLVDTWGGFVFINMDLTAEPLRSFLGPVPAYLDGFEFEKWRYRWYKTVILPCNWKTALEGFNEAYHVAATHPQILEHMGDDVTRSFTFGPHGMYRYPLERRPLGAPSSRTGKPMPDDLRAGIVRHWQEMDETLRAMYSPRSVAAVQRLMSETPADASIEEMYADMMRFQREAAEIEGAGWPELTGQDLYEAGTNWHIFPNHVFLPLTDASIAYRARPNGDDPDSCIFDVWSLVRYAPGQEPPLVREFYPDWTQDTEANFGLVLSQDFANFAQVQKGMHSRGFEALRTSPLQESEIPNMHRALWAYISAPDEPASPRPEAKTRP